MNRMRLPSLAGAAALRARQLARRRRLGLLEGASRAARVMRQWGGLRRKQPLLQG